MSGEFQEGLRRSQEPVYFFLFFLSEATCWKTLSEMLFVLLSSSVRERNQEKGCSATHENKTFGNIFFVRKLS